MRHRTFPELFDIDRKHVRPENVWLVARRWQDVYFGLESAWMVAVRYSERGLEASSLKSTVATLAVYHQSLMDSDIVTCRPSKLAVIPIKLRRVRVFWDGFQMACTATRPPLGLN